MPRFMSLLTGLLFLPSLAQAVPVLSWDNPTLDGGVISYAGAGGPVTATDVIFQAVIGVDTPANAGVSLFCVPGPCLLSFTTGDNALLEGPPIWTFDEGGSITMTGGLNTLADGTGTQILPAGTALLVSGQFDPPGELVLGGTNSLQFTGQGSDEKHATLAAFYGLANPFSFVTTELSLGQAEINPGTGAFTATVTDSDFQNTAAAVIPQAASGLLVGLGLLSLVARKRP